MLLRQLTDAGGVNRVRTILSMATILDTRGLSIPTLKVTSQACFIWASTALRSMYTRSSDALAFVMRQKAGGSWPIYRQQQCFSCRLQQRAMPLRRWRRFVSDCQEWAKQPLAANKARWTNGGGLHGRKRRLSWKGRGTWEGRRIVELSCSCHTVVVSSFGRSCLHVDRWPRQLQITMSLKFFSGSLCQMIPALCWQHNFASHDAVTSPEPIPPSPCTREQWRVYRRPFNRRAHLPWSRQQPVGVGKYYVGASALLPYQPVVNTVRCPAGMMLKIANACNANICKFDFHTAS